MIKELQDMDIVAEGVPQFYNVQSGYYKHKSKTIPPIPKFVDDIKLKDESGHYVKMGIGASQ